jgi:hypothetical protein
MKSALESQGGSLCVQFRLRAIRASRAERSGVEGPRPERSRRTSGAGGGLRRLEVAPERRCAPTVHLRGRNPRRPGRHRRSPRSHPRWGRGSSGLRRRNTRPERSRRTIGAPPDSSAYLPGRGGTWSKFGTRKVGSIGAMPSSVSAVKFSSSVLVRSGTSKV